MVTIHTSEPLTFPRPYISGFAVFGEDISTRLEAGLLTINNEVAHSTLTLKVNGEVYPARSRSYFLDEVFIEAECAYIVEGLPTDLNVNVFIDSPKKDGYFAICIEYTGVVEAFRFEALPLMGGGYWMPPPT